MSAENYKERELQSKNIANNHIKMFIIHQQQ